MTKRIFLLLILTGLLLPSLAFGNDADDLQNISTKNTTLPIYNRDKLQALLFGGEIRRRGGIILVDNPVIDLVRANVDIDLVKGGPVTPYPLHAKGDEVFAFWKKRAVFSDGVVVSSEAEVDQQIQQAVGKNPVFFRSPMLDVDGVGYHADYANKNCLIQSEVKVVMRTGIADLKAALESGKAPAEGYDELNASSDTLFVDLKNNEITFTDNVVVDQTDNIIRCDKMVIYLTQAPQQDAAAGSSIDIGGTSGEISQIICTGNVEIEQKAPPAQTPEKRPSFDIFGKRRTSDGSFRQIASTIDRELNPSFQWCAEVVDTPKAAVKVANTRIKSDESSFDYKNNVLVFTGKVKLTDSRLDLDCEILKVFLSNLDADGNVIPGASKDKGHKAITRIECYGKVKAVDSSGELYCEELKIDLKERAGRTQLSKMEADKNVKLIKLPAPDATPEERAQPPSTLTADRGVLLYDENRADFFGHVKVVDKDIELTSDKLTLHTLPLQPPPPPVEADPNAIPDDSGAKTVPKQLRVTEDMELQKIVADKNVVIVRKPGKLNETSQQAIGDKAVYTVRDGEIVLTGTPERPPKVIDGENILNTRPGSRIVVDLNSERVDVLDGGAELQISDEIKQGK